MFKRPRLWGTVLIQTITHVHLAFPGHLHISIPFLPLAHLNMVFVADLRATPWKFTYYFLAISLSVDYLPLMMVWLGIYQLYVGENVIYILEIVP